jgi:RimJ/RimL family protein N-acetyltransferase
MATTVTLESARLTLRPYREGDFESFAALNGDARAREHMDGPLDRSEAAERFERCISREENRVEAWAVTLKETALYVGHCYLVASERGDDAEVGFILQPNVWRRGYGAEAATAVVRYGLTRKGYARIVATVDRDHHASIKVLERAGMALEREVSDERGGYLVYAASTRGPSGRGTAP